jgi:hypothetical protein
MRLLFCELLCCAEYISSNAFWVCRLGYLFHFVCFFIVTWKLKKDLNMAVCLGYHSFVTKYTALFHISVELVSFMPTLAALAQEALWVQMGAPDDFLVFYATLDVCFLLRCIYVRQSTLLLLVLEYIVWSAVANIYCFKCFFILPLQNLYFVQVSSFYQF